MPILLVLAVGAVGWALYTGRITIKQLPPLIVVLAGAGLALRGLLPIGIGTLVFGSLWLAGTRRRVNQEQSNAYRLARARDLLGATALDDAETIRQRHRSAMAANHPDKGGSDARAAELNEARDILLREIAGKSR